jgi:tetratricopeptide (TPR) repeat protein
LDLNPLRERRRGVFLLLLAACLLPYANGLTGGFTYDDKAIVRDNPRIHSPSSVGRVFTTQYFGGARGKGSAYRPVLLLSFALQWWLHGGHVLFFHGINVLLHLAVTVLLWRLFLRLRQPPAVAAAAALLFAVHPIHVEAVTSLVGRGETLSGVWILSYLLLALSRPGRPPAAPALFGALLCYLLGVFTKESAAVAPLLAFLLYFRLEPGTFFGRLLGALRRGLPLFAGSVLLLLGVFQLRALLLGGYLRSTRASIFELENPLAPLPALERVSNASLILVHYLGRTVLPLFLSADESARSLSLLDWPSPSLLFFPLLLLTLAAASAARVRARPAAALGFLFFAIAFLPAANLLFPIGTVFAERLAYLPSAGVCLVLAGLLAPRAWGRGGGGGGKLLLLAVVVLLFAARTVVRNTVWESDEALFANSVRTSPASAKAHYNLAWVSAENGRMVEALSHYKRAVEIYPKYWDAWAGRGRVERLLGRPAESERSFREALSAWPGFETGYFGLGLLREDRGDDAGAEQIYERGLARKADSLPLLFRLAAVRSRLDRPNAGETWQRALAVGPGSVPSRLGYARWLFARGREAEGRRQVREILRRHPGRVDALRLLAEENARDGRLLAEALARERVLRATRSAGDFASLQRLAAESSAYRQRFERLRPLLERLVGSR